LLGEGREQLEPKDLRGMTTGTEFTACPECGKGELKIRASHFGTVFIACTGYPLCKNTMSMPKGIVGLQILPNQKCQKCWNLRKREVILFKLTFQKEVINQSISEVLPYAGGTSGIFCVIEGCNDFHRLELYASNPNYKRPL
jgi:hypothetical protein